MSFTDESAEEGIVAEQRVSRVSREAIMQLVDRDVTLVERRVASCKRQYKIAIPLTRDAPQAQSHTGWQGRPQVSCGTARSLARSTASAVWGFCLVRLPPLSVNLV